MNLKHSRQRSAIKEFLMTRHDHPTANVVYENLRKDFPKLSLGTVYRNLTLLTEMGEIRKLHLEDGVDRFDGQVAPHFHFICTSCHRVLDLNLDPTLSSDLDAQAAASFDGRIDGHATHFYGLCGNCISASETK